MQIFALKICQYCQLFNVKLALCLVFEFRYNQLYDLFIVAINTKIPHNYLSFTGFLYLFQEFTLISSKSKRYYISVDYTRVNDLEMSREIVKGIVKEK